MGLPVAGRLVTEAAKGSKLRRLAGHRGWLCCDDAGSPRWIFLMGNLPWVRRLVVVLQFICTGRWIGKG